MIDKKVFQDIFDEVIRLVSFNWDRLVVYLEYGEDSYSFSFYVKTGKEYVKCFDLPNVSEDAIMLSFRKIDKIVSKERARTGQDKWSNMTMTVTSDGLMHTDFDYSDLSQGTYQYKKAWKKKYLI